MEGCQQLFDRMVSSLPDAVVQVHLPLVIGSAVEPGSNKPRVRQTCCQMVTTCVAQIILPTKVKICAASAKEQQILEPSNSKTQPLSSHRYLPDGTKIVRLLSLVFYHKNTTNIVGVSVHRQTSRAQPESGLTHFFSPVQKFCANSNQAPS